MLGDEGEDITDNIDLLKMIHIFNPEHTGSSAYSKVPDIVTQVINENKIIINFGASDLYRIDDFGTKDGIADNIIFFEGFFTDKNGKVIKGDFKLEVEDIL